MKSKPTYRKSERPKLMYKKDIAKMQAEIEETAIVLMLAYMMDEEDFDEARIKRMWQKMEEWMNAVSEHLLTVDKVREIIHDKKGWAVE